MYVSVIYKYLIRNWGKLVHNSKEINVQSHTKLQGILIKIFYRGYLQDTGNSLAQNSCKAKQLGSQEFPRFRGDHSDNKTAFNLHDFSSLLLANKPGSSPCSWRK